MWKSRNTYYKSSKWYNIHHKIWKCNRKWANVEDSRNKMTIERTRHDWLNSLFQCLQSPHEQLEYLRDMYDSILSDIAKQLFDELIGLNRKDFYSQWLVKC